MPPLSLHHLTVLDVPHHALAEIAGAVGCAHVTLFTHLPEQLVGKFPCVAPGDVPALADTLAAAGVSVCNLEVFPLDRDGDLDRFAAGLEMGAALGATRATIHIHDCEDRATAARRVAAFCAVADRYGIVGGLEFNAFSAVKDIRSAVETIREAGCGSVALDALHLMRNGADVACVADAADLITYVQLCDGPLITHQEGWVEAVRERLLPGAGEFPLADILRPISPQAVIEAEVPQTVARKAGVSALDRARRAVDAMRACLARSP